MKILMAIALVFSTIACGVKKAPRPPESTMAVAPADIRVMQDDGAVRVKWKRPTSSVDGARLYDLAWFVVERADVTRVFLPIHTAPVTDNDRLRPQRTFEYRDADAPHGELFYRVRAFTADGLAGQTSEVIQVFNGSRPLEADAQVGNAE